MVESLPALDACLCGLESNSYCRVLYLNTESQGPHMLDKKLIARGLAGNENKYLFLLQMRNKEVNISPSHNMESFGVKRLTVGSKNRIKTARQKQKVGQEYALMIPTFWFVIPCRLTEYTFAPFSYQFVRSNPGIRNRRRSLPDYWNKIMQQTRKPFQQ